MGRIFFLPSRNVAQIPGELMKKLYALWALFRKGEEVANPARWKNRTITINALAAVVLAVGALAASFGLDLGLNDDMAAQIGGGVLAVGNIIMHVITSQKVGLSARGSSDAATGTTGQDHLGTLGRPFSENDL